jgi:hypothetical protein
MRAEAGVFIPLSHESHRGHSLSGRNTIWSSGKDLGNWSLMSRLGGAYAHSILAIQEMNTAANAKSA